MTTTTITFSTLIREWERWLGTTTTSSTAYITTVIITITFIIFLIEFHRKKRTLKKKFDSMNCQNEDELINDINNNKCNGIDVSFSNIKLVLSTKRDEKVILNGSVTGYAKSGEMLAILGPSGAGKSSLLHAIAGKIKYKRTLSLSGYRYINNNNSTNTIQLSSDSLLPSTVLIEQDVTFFPHMTVYETILFRVQLKLGLHNQYSNRLLVSTILNKLDLQRVTDTIVGDTGKIRGISGGERKRLSIAVEMITSPSIILLDEPTSGLDSTSALQLVRTLQLLAKGSNSTGSIADHQQQQHQQQRTTIIAVLHQPNQHVLDSFDTLLLLGQGGQQMYFGQRSTVRKYLTETANCPVSSTEIGTAEHCLDCISNFPMNTNEISNPSLVSDRIHRLVQLSSTTKQSTTSMTTTTTPTPCKEQRYSSSNSGPQSSIIVQFQLLFLRSSKEIIRSKLTILLYMVRLVSMALIYGSIYQLQLTQTSINDRFGLLSLIIIGAANMGMSKTIRTFPKEKAIVSYELASNLYNTAPYFISKALSEIPLTGLLNSVFGILVYKATGLDPTSTKLFNFVSLLIIHGIVSESVGLFIGSISPNSDVALAMYPAIVVLNIIFDGKNISEENIPKLLRWIPKIGLIRWGFEGLCINEFDGLVFDTSSSSSSSGGNIGGHNLTEIRTGTEALARFGLLSNRTVLDVIQAQITIALACWILSYLGLTLTRQKFVQMHKPC